MKEQHVHILRGVNVQLVTQSDYTAAVTTAVTLADNAVSLCTYLNGIVFRMRSAQTFSP